MKKKYSILFSFLIALLFLSNNAIAKNIYPIAVFSANTKTINSSSNIYEDTPNLIAHDISNTLAREVYEPILDPLTSKRLIKKYNLLNDYNKLLFTYKKMYAIDRQLSKEIAIKSGIDKFLLVSGSFNVQEGILNQGILHHLNIPGEPFYSPEYKLEIVVCLVDSLSGEIMWEKSYTKNMKVKNFEITNQGFGENYAVINEIKKFSSRISKKASRQIAKEIRSYVPSINQEKYLPVTKSDYQPVKSTEELNNSHEKIIIEKRKKNYKNWTKEHIHEVINSRF